MKSIKDYLNHLFIDGLSGMARGLFATLIIGTIMDQVGMLVGGEVGAYIRLIAGFAKAMTGAGIGAAVAARYQAGDLVTVSAAVCGLVGAYSCQDIQHQLLIAVYSMLLHSEYAGDDLLRFQCYIQRVEILVAVAAVSADKASISA